MSNIINNTISHIVNASIAGCFWGNIDGFGNSENCPPLTENSIFNNTSTFSSTIPISRENLDHTIIKVRMGNIEYYKNVLLDRVLNDELLFVSRNCSGLGNIIETSKNVSVNYQTHQNGPLEYSLLFLLMTIAVVIRPYIQYFGRYIVEKIQHLYQMHRDSRPTFSFLNNFNFHNSNASRNENNLEHGSIEQSDDKPSPIQQRRNPQILLRDISSRSNS